jgi:hypothetical protein
MPLKQLTIEVERPPSTIIVRYNPEELTINKDNNFAVQTVFGRSDPLVQFVNGNQRTLDVELFFDTYDTPVVPKADVRDETRQVTDLMNIESESHAPPILVLAMAQLRFRCVLSRVSQRFVLFMPNGTPVRARLQCTFVECVDPAPAAAAANLQTADFTKVHTVTRGETLSSIAALRYDDPALWRPIAMANDIADAAAIAPGQSLRIPPLPYVDPLTREVVR